MPTPIADHTVAPLELFQAILAQESASGTQVLGAPSAEGAPAGTEGVDGSGNGQEAPQSPMGGMLLPIMALFLGFMLLTTFLGGRKDKKKRAEMLSSLKRTDKVQTIGGMIGTVVELRDTEAVLKVHESSNTRVTVSRSAIQQVIKSGRGGGSESANNDDPAQSEAGAEAEPLAAAS